MQEDIFKPIGETEPQTSFGNMDYLREFLMTNKKKSDFSTFVRKKIKGKK